VLVLVERSEADGTVRRSTCALLTVARRLGTPVAVLCGPVDAASIALLGRFGATTVCTVTSPEVDESPATSRVETLVELARRMSPTTILIASGRAGQEIAARVAVRLDSGIVTDAIDIRMGPDGPIAVQSVLAGSYLVESSVVRGVPVFTIRTGATAELGWCPRDAKIDQIGRIIHPRLHIALGISGSVRHRAAIQGAGTIVAIDRDPAAPIFRIADLGVVGDLHQVIPELLAEIRRRKGQPVATAGEPAEV
jgi:electron transfer flavoprotein alpha subunit